MRTPREDLKDLMEHTCWVTDMEDPNTSSQQLDLGMLEIVIVRFRENKKVSYGYTVSNTVTGATLMLSVNIDKKNLLDDLSKALEALGIPMDAYR